MEKALVLLKTFCFFVAVLFITLFSMKNSEVVKINLAFIPFGSTVEIRAFLLIILCFAVGFLCGASSTMYAIVKTYLSAYLYKKKTEEKGKNNEESKSG